MYRISSETDGAVPVASSNASWSLTSSSEWPPASKKFVSRSKTRPGSTFRHAFSTAPVTPSPAPSPGAAGPGATVAATGAGTVASGGAGSRLRSILPFGVSGSSPRASRCEGTANSGSTARRWARTASSTEGRSSTA